MTTYTPRVVNTAEVATERRKEVRKQLPNYLFILPHYLFFIIFLLYPIFRGIQISFFDWKIMLEDQNFIGLANYEALLTDNVFKETFGNTVYFAVLTVFLNVVVALLVAVALKNSFRGSNFMRILFYAPAILSVSVLGIIGIRIWDTQLGIVNFFLVDLLGLSRISWLGNPSLVVPSLALTTVWWTFGFPMLIFLAGLQGIPESLYEAAKIDGSGRLQTFRHITLPLLMPTMLFVVVTQFISHMQVFAQPFIITGGGPGNGSRTAVMYLYETAWRFFRFGYASAISVALAVIMIIIAAILFVTMRRRAEY
jgi:multiple sugar transport system permease protein